MLQRHLEVEIITANFFTLMSISSQIRVYKSCACECEENNLFAIVLSPIEFPEKDYRTKEEPPVFTDGMGSINHRVIYPQHYSMFLPKMSFPHVRQTTYTRTTAVSVFF